MKSLVAPFSTRSAFASVALGLAVGLLVVAQLWDWRPTDMRRLTVTLREASPVFAIAASALALFNARVLTPESVIAGPVPARGRALVLIRQVVVSAGTLLVGAASTVAVTAAVQVSLAPTLAEVLALAAWAAGVVAVVAIAHLVAVLVPYPVTWLATPIVTVLATIFPVILNDGALDGTGYSTLATSLTWGFAAPVGAWSYIAEIELFRFAFFLLLAACTTAAAVEASERSSSPLRRIGIGTAWLLLPALLVAGTTWLSPHIVVEDRDEYECASGRGFTGCVFREHAAVLPHMVGAAEAVLDQLPEAAMPAVRLVEAGLPEDDGTVISETLPSTLETYRSEISQAVALSAVAFTRCDSRTAGSREIPAGQAESMEAAHVLAQSLMYRAGIEQDGGHQRLNNLSDDEFRRWWEDHRELFSDCKLTSSDLDG